MTPSYADRWLTVYQGDCREVLPTLPAASVDCVVTSPPYWMQRSYLPDAHEHKGAEIGSEAEYQAWQDTIVGVCRELGRVLARTGSLWLNLGDKFRANGGEYRYPGDLGNAYQRGQNAPGHNPLMRRKWTHGYPDGTRRKSLILAPYRVALALLAEGWILRDEIIWHKTNALPESVADRFARRHEVMFRFTLDERAHFDLDAVRVPYADTTLQRTMAHRAETFAGNKSAAPGQPPRSPRPPTFGGTKGAADGVTRMSGREWTPYAAEGRSSGSNADLDGKAAAAIVRGERSRDIGRSAVAGMPALRYASRLRRTDGSNPGDVWSVATSGARGRGFNHFAMFPPDLVERPILATCPPGGVVLDPFAGTGTTLEVANRLGRRAIGIELDPSQLEAIRRRTGRLEGAVAEFRTEEPA